MQATLDHAAQCPDSARGHDAFRGTTDTHEHVDTRIRASSRDRAGNIAVEDQLGARTRLADLFDHVSVTWTIKHGHRHLRRLLTLSLRNTANVLADRQAEINRIRGLRAGHELIHVEHCRRVVHRPAFSNSHHGQRIVQALRRQTGAVDRVNRNIGFGAVTGTHVLAVEQHRGFILLALTDHHDTVEINGREHRTHRIDSRAVCPVLVAVANPRGRCDRRDLSHADQLHRQVPVRNSRRNGQLRGKLGVVLLLRHGVLFSVLACSNNGTMPHVHHMPLHEKGSA